MPVSIPKGPVSLYHPLPIVCRARESDGRPCQFEIAGKALARQARLLSIPAFQAAPSIRGSDLTVVAS